MECAQCRHHAVGSKSERRGQRLKELKGACRYLGFGLWLPAPGGLERVSAATRSTIPRLGGTM